MSNLFDTLHVKLKGPICKCRATRRPDKGAYAIYFPVDVRGLTDVKIECNLCNTSLTIPWKDLNGAVVYSKPKTKPKTSTPKATTVVTRAREAGSPGTEVGVVGSAKEAERRLIEEMLGGTQLKDVSKQLAALWEMAPDTSALFPQVSAEPQEQKPGSPGSPHEPEAAPEREPEAVPSPKREPETAAPEPEASADTRPAYMRHLGLEEQQ